MDITPICYQMNKMRMKMLSHYDIKTEKTKNQLSDYIKLYYLALRAWRQNDVNKSDNRLNLICISCSICNRWCRMDVCSTAFRI